jgi:hypothetical protein
MRYIEAQRRSISAADWRLVPAVAVWALFERSASSGIWLRQILPFKRVPKPCFLSSANSMVESEESGCLKTCGFRYFENAGTNRPERVGIHEHHSARSAYSVMPKPELLFRVGVVVVLDRSVDQRVEPSIDSCPFRWQAGHRGGSIRQPARGVEVARTRPVQAQP